MRTPSLNRLVLIPIVTAVLAGAGGGVALARTGSPSVSTGVVVVDTNLGYQGGKASGTGTVLTSSGEILTNNHVIEGATSVKVTVPDTGKSYAARVVGYDTTDDVAVLQASGASNLDTADIERSSSVGTGQSVTKVGNAGGTGTLTSSSGTVTGTNRSITVSGDDGQAEHLTGLIETNAGLQPGDSGGPLETSDGTVVGMDTAATVGNSGGFAGYGGDQETVTADGYAIPIDRAMSIVRQIESGQSSSTVHVGGTAFLGVELAGPGAMVAGVTSGGAAEAAGLQQGDQITAVDGHAVDSPDGVGSLLTTKRPGDRISVTFTDGTRETHTTPVALGSGPPQ